MSPLTLDSPTLEQARELPQALSLEALTHLDLAALRAHYQAGRCPDLRALDGAPRGRMLAVAGLDGLLANAFVRRLAAARFFPWAGKSFESVGANGAGINRVRLLGTREWYRFTTRAERSVLDGRPCVLLDYDHAENPWPIRRIRDELREVSPGLFLGPALARVGRSHKLALFFAVEQV